METPKKIGKWPMRVIQLVVGALLILFAYTHQDWGFTAGAIAFAGMCFWAAIPLGIRTGETIVEKGDPHAHKPD